jgi:streptogramin lyase
LVVPSAQAAEVTGTVTDAEKRPIPGAMVSVRDEVRNFYETVYSDAQGRFRLTTQQQGDLVLRARKLSFADASRPLRLDSASAVAIDLTLTILTKPEDIADNLPSSAHFSKIPFDATGPNSRAAIQMTCANCHSLGSAFNRIPRLPEEWAPVVARMFTENVAVPPADLNPLTQSRASKFAAGFTDDLPKLNRTQMVSPELSGARVTEWAIPGDIPLPYGIAASSRDGRLYVTDNGMPRLLVIDPKGKDVTELPVGSHAFRTRGIAEGLDGKMYLTAPVLGLVGALDLTSTEIIWTLVGARSPGTIRVGKDGIIWWTHQWDDGAEDRQGVGWVGRLDPTTSEVTLITLPFNGPQDYVVPSFQPFTLGIDLDPASGDVWYSKLYANKIGRINARTLAAEEFTPPQMGPRGMHFAKDGTLWVAFAGSGSIASLDPKTMKWQVYRLPTLSPEETEAPYTLAIHPATQDVWVTANQSDQVYRFIPGERRFVTYPLPTRDTFMRDIAFTQDGLVCSTSGPLPPINTEGGYPLVICIDPGGRNR